MQTQEITTFKPYELDPNIDLDTIRVRINEHTRNGIIEMVTIGGYLDRAKQLCLDGNLNFKVWLSTNTKYNLPQCDRLCKAYRAVIKYPLILENQKSSISQVLLDYDYYENPDKVTSKEIKKRPDKDSYSALKRELEQLKKKYMDRELRYKEPNEHVQDLTLQLVSKETELAKLRTELDKIKSTEGIINITKLKSDTERSTTVSVIESIKDWVRYKKSNNIKFSISDLIEYLDMLRGGTDNEQ